MLTLRFFLVLLMATVLAACSPMPSKGRWLGQQDNAEVGLILKKRKNCEIYVAREGAPARSQLCKYEARDGAYLIYLFKADGQCNVDADFEFVYNLKTKRINLLVGGEVLSLALEAQPDG